jgi:hypothetical protein
MTDGRAPGSVLIRHRRRANALRNERPRVE